MQYRTPLEQDEALLRDYAAEHLQAGEESLSASFGLTGMAYPDWLASIRRQEESGPFGKALLFLCFDGDVLAGLLSVRYAMPPELAEKYGHIGYGVRPSLRRRGYATRMLRFGLEVCREKGLRQVILGCFADNAASARTIEKCGGVLYEESERYREGRLSRYYYILLNDTETEKK